MPEATPGATPAAPATGAEPQAPVDQQPPATDGQPDALGDAGKRAIDAMKAERDEATKALKAAQAELKKHTDAQLSEQEKLTNRVAELEQENATKALALQSMTFRSSAVAAASKAGFWDPEVAVALIDPAEVKYDEAGQPTNIDALLKDVAKAKPRLVNGQGDAGLGPRGGAPGAGMNMNDLIRRASGH